jgi:hypothetical protein
VKLEQNMLKPVLRIVSLISAHPSALIMTVNLFPVITLRIVGNNKFLILLCPSKRELVEPVCGLRLLVALYGQCANKIHELPHLLFSQPIFVRLHIAARAVTDYHEDFAVA